MADSLTKELERLLVRWHYEPTLLPHQLEHYIEHVFSLLPDADREAVLSYYGVLGREQLSLHEIAAAHSLPDEEMLSRIDRSVRRIAVTPEWQSLIKTKDA